MYEYSVKTPNKWAYTTGITVCNALAFLMCILIILKFQELTDIELLIYTLMLCSLLVLGYGVYRTKKIRALHYWFNNFTKKYPRITKAAISYIAAETKKHNREMGTHFNTNEKFIANVIARVVYEQYTSSSLLTKFYIERYQFYEANK